MAEISTKRFNVHEDWVVVALGFLVILFIVFFYVIPVPGFKWEDSTALGQNLLSPKNLGKILFQFVFLLLIGSIGVVLLGKSISRFIMGFPVVYFITIVAMVLTGNAFVKSLNLEAVIFSLAIGLAISNFFELPQWFKDTLSTELFVKIGLVLLGTSIIFADILKAGSLGLIQALLVVISVWYFAFWLCKKLKVDPELTMMISSAVSICGVSAAIATSGAIKGDPKKLSYVISMVLITAIPMMIFMPYIASYLSLSQQVTGAWLGGSIDTTGAVVASGTLVGEEALKISTIVKFSQNVLLGIAAFAISIYWTYNRTAEGSNVVEKPTLKVIWDRFPKFVLGFVGASLLFSFFLSPQTIAPAKESLKNLQTTWFTLAFTSIGLETNFKDLFKHDNKKPLYAFLLAQLFNILVTLLIAYLLFD